MLSCADWCGQVLQQLTGGCGQVLQQLQLSHNRLDSLEGLPHLPHLELLNVPIPLLDSLSATC